MSINYQDKILSIIEQFQNQDTKQFFLQRWQQISIMAIKLDKQFFNHLHQFIETLQQTNLLTTQQKNQLFSFVQLQCECFIKNFEIGCSNINMKENVSNQDVNDVPILFTKSTKLAHFKQNLKNNQQIQNNGNSTDLSLMQLQKTNQRQKQSQQNDRKVQLLLEKVKQQQTVINFQNQMLQQQRQQIEQLSQRK